MAQNKKSFVAYCDWLDSFEELSDEEAGKLVKHLFRYVNDKNPEAPDKLTKMCFIPIQQSLKRDLKKYEAYVKKQSENGLKGGRPPKPKEPKKPNALNGNPTEPKKADSVSVSVSVNESTNVDINSHSDFDLFFMAYNKKVDLIPCQREWSNIDKAEHQKILKHVPKYVSAIHDKKYLKSPLKYLKDITWLDEDLPNAKPKTERFIPTPPKIY